MRQYERNGITVDQCTECRGVYLDHGELERLVSAENAYYAAPTPPQPPQAAPQGFPQYGQYIADGQPVPPPQPVYPTRRSWGSADSPDSPSRYGYGYGVPRQSRRRSFLENLFD